jgi:hypothetical protein
MRARGWQQNRRGRWFDPDRVADVRARVAGGPLGGGGVDQEEAIAPAAADSRGGPTTRQLDDPDTPNPERGDGQSSGDEPRQSRRSSPANLLVVKPGLS